ncbi:tRNA (adenine(58)-N(1))-methyltransferase non-catalytic subunit trm6 [Gaertneriomyces sp. JEL0708]|nr:tRNA (adenine(58)-N(1))-methyltransferase non-catalytic subunit trm6 [Gaertneriomyces sp. JEL0708]
MAEDSTIGMMDVDTSDQSDQVHETSIAVGGNAQCDPDIVDKGAIIQDGSWAVITMPSEKTKIVCFEMGKVVELGRLGKIKGDHFIGLPFDVPYEIYDKNCIRAVNDVMNFDDFDTTAEDGANNKDLNDSREAQKLTQEQIEQLRDAGSSNDVIKALIENSDTYEKKTEFAKTKYIKRKQQKYSKILVPRRPSARWLCEHFFEADPKKINEIRVDTLSQLVTYGNVRAGGRYLIVDDAGGLLTAALAERLQGNGTIFVLHPHESNNINLVKHMNLSEDAQKSIVGLPWTRLEPNDDEADTSNPEAIRDEERRAKFLQRIKGVREKRAYLKQGGFDGLLLISHYDIRELITTLEVFLAPSAPVVAYSPHKELLVESFMHLRRSRQFINAQLTESWMREYQVPVHAHGTHPRMTMSGRGGYLLSGIKVLDNEEAVAFSAKKVVNKKVKVEHVTEVEA